MLFQKLQQKRMVIARDRFQKRVPVKHLLNERDRSGLRVEGVRTDCVRLRLSSIPFACGVL